MSRFWPHFTATGRILAGLAVVVTLIGASSIPEDLNKWRELIIHVPPVALRLALWGGFTSLCLIFGYQLLTQNIGSVFTQKKTKCPRCKGSGLDWNRYESPCPKCKATGEVPSKILLYPPCKPCKGTGWAYNRYEQECKTCNGWGRRLDESQIN